MDRFRPSFSLRQSNPFSALDEMVAETMGGFRGEHPEIPVSAPPVKILREAERIILQIELPGVERSDLTVALQDETLTVDALQRAPQSEDAIRLVRIIHLPETIKRDRIAARMEGGLLSITLPHDAPSAGDSGISHRF